MSGPEVARSVAALFPTPALREYARWKVRLDPAYDAVLERLRGHAEPVADLGCGIGLLAFHLRASGVVVPLVGIDFDERKIAVARQAAAGTAGLEFRQGDARDPCPAGHNVVMLDVLQYFGAADRATILANAARAVPPGGVVLLRAGLRDRSWRYRVTWLVDALARAFRWMRAERIEFPAREEIIAAFPGFEAEAVPLWGRMPFNNWLFVFRKGDPTQSPAFSCPSSGITKS